MFEIVDRGEGWCVIGPCPWTGEQRVLFRGWRPDNPLALEDSGIAMTGLQDCIHFVKEARNDVQ